METSTTSPRHRTVIALLLLAAGVAGGYAWGSNGTAPSASTGTTISSVANRATATGHNESDVHFAQMMVSHHRQALQMAKLADTRASSRGVKDLAASIEDAQQPEIDTMTGWLTEWGAGPVPSATHMDMGSSSMGEGMMSGSDMQKLGTLRGTAFDTSFLTMMIGHHQGAITMARDELKTGQSADALALASSIAVTQQAQVSQMRRLLKS